MIERFHTCTLLLNTRYTMPKALRSRLLDDGISVMADDRRASYGRTHLHGAVDTIRMRMDRATGRARSVMGHVARSGNRPGNASHAIHEGRGVSRWRRRLFTMRRTTP